MVGGRGWLTATRVTATVIMPVLLAAFVILFAFPGRTARLWAWTIRPDMSAITMGAGYLGGVWFFHRVRTNTEPHRVVCGLAAATVFTAMLGVATFAHWDRFNHDHVSFWAWTFLYVASPLLLPVLAIANHRAGARPGPGDTRLARSARLLLGSVGLGLLVVALSWFAHPAWGMQIWPWAATPLTVRSLSAFVAFTGALLLWPWFDDRRDAAEIGLQAVTVGLAAIMVGALRGRADFTGPTASRAIYVVALVIMLVMVVSVQRGARPADRVAGDQPVGSPQPPTPGRGPT